MEEHQVDLLEAEEAQVDLAARKGVELPLALTPRAEATGRAARHLAGLGHLEE